MLILYFISIRDISLHMMCRDMLTDSSCFQVIAGTCPYTRVCTSVSIARSSALVHAPPVVSRCIGSGLPPGASAGWK